MKIRPRKAMLIGLASSVLFSASGCVTREEAVTDTDEKITTENNEPVDVYGPPDIFEPATEENIPVTVYGPPEMLTTEKNEVPTLYGPPEEFTGEEITVDDNEPVDVYGPPESF